MKKFCGPIMVGDVILHSDIITEFFCCDIEKCQGRCCEEGDAGAPVTLEEVAHIEQQLDELWPRLSAGAQRVIDKEGIVYTDPEGELVTSIIDHGDCVFRGCHGCLLSERPMSCHLYPIRAKQMGPFLGLNYHRWDICADALVLGRARGIRVYEFLHEALVRLLGEPWYEELCKVAQVLLRQQS